MNTRTWVTGWVLMTLLLTGVTPVLADPPAGGGLSFDRIPWRAIGPATFGGRISDIEADPADPAVVYVGASSGGVFKSINGGTTWTAVFDGPGRSMSIGDIALAPSDPNVVWVGTGEANGDQNPATIGTGVYRSLDGGATWQHLGLADTHHIGRVLVHPGDPDTAWVAAAGHLWGPNPERGLYRTRDGGRTWQLALAIDEDTGVVDVAMEPNGRVLYAAAWQRRRTAWGIVDGGPGSGLHQSLDGGDTWRRLTVGLPADDLQKIGVAVSASHPHIAYAIVGHAEGGVFRTDDRGRSWRRVNPMRSPGYWYGQIKVDPVNPDKVWVPGVQLAVSIDGGRTFETDWTARNVHVDHHAIWINPARTGHQYLGNDGGFCVTWDGGRTWDFRNNLPLAQYYAIGVDRRQPYWVYGGLQDNGTWGVASRTYHPHGITNADTVCIAWGDGFYAAVDPTDPGTIYAESQFGVLQRVSLEPRELKLIQPVPADPAETYRFTWNSPLQISPHQPQRLFFGGNKLFRSDDRGQSWAEISPDLTRNEDLSGWTIMGRKPSLRAYNAITSLAESARRPGLIWVGTDDGLVHLTQDGGATWQNLSDRIDLPGTRFVTRVLPSTHADGRAWVAFTGHYANDYRPHLFRTDDFGRTWQALGPRMPPHSVVRCVLEHPGQPDLLLVGVHNGLLFSPDAGQTWRRVEGDLPPVGVDDMVITPEENDLVLGTYGRGVFILDDITFLEQASPAALSEPAHLFPPRPATQFIEIRPTPDMGDGRFLGPNPPYGAALTWHVAPPTGADPPGPARLIILDEQGRTVRQLEGPAGPGFHRLHWDLRHAHALTGPPDRGRPRVGPFVLPGLYTVQLAVNGVERTVSLAVRPDPRSPASPTDLAERLRASQALVAVQVASEAAGRTARTISEELQRLKPMLQGRNDLPAAVAERLARVEKALADPAGGRGGGWVEAGLLGQIQGNTAPPSQSDWRRIRQLTEAAARRVERLNEVVDDHWPALARALGEAGLALRPLTPLDPPPAPPDEGQAPTSRP